MHPNNKNTRIKSSSWQTYPLRVWRTELLQRVAGLLCTAFWDLLPGYHAGDLPFSYCIRLTANSSGNGPQALLQSLTAQSQEGSIASLEWANFRRGLDRMIAVWLSSTSYLYAAFDEVGPLLDTVSMRIYSYLCVVAISTGCMLQRALCSSSGAGTITPQRLRTAIL